MQSNNDYISIYIYKMHCTTEISVFYFKTLIDELVFFYMRVENLNTSLSTYFINKSPNCYNNLDPKDS